MTIATNDIEQAARAAAQIRAHEMCIDKIEEMDAEIKTLAERVVKLNGENERLKGEVHMLALTGDQLMEEMKAANRRNVKHKEALDYIAQGSYAGASHIAMEALGLI